MTERLYYRDSKLLEFEATVIEHSDQGGQVMTVLDRTAFYPTSGGQLCDRGTLNGEPVIDVRESDQGDVWHITRQPAGAVGERLRGIIDGVRRRRAREQHTAQHILSQSFSKVCNLETVSVHLGEEYGAIELEGGIPDEAGLQRAESLANEVILENVPVEVLFVEAAEASKLLLRKLPGRSGTIRVIKIGEFDWSACGGTHCQSSGEVGFVKIIGCERVRGHTLVRFLAGVQASDDYAIRFQVTDRLSKQLTCHVNDLVDKVSKLIDESRKQRKHLTELQKEMLPHRAEQFAAQSKVSGTVRYVAAAVSEMEPALIGSLAQMTAERIGGFSALMSNDKLVIAVLSGSGLHAGNIAKKLTAQFGLRGGGNERVAQVGGAQIERLEEYVTAIMATISHD